MSTSPSIAKSVSPNNEVTITWAETAFAALQQGTDLGLQLRVLDSNGNWSGWSPVYWFRVNMALNTPVFATRTIGGRCLPMISFTASDPDSQTPLVAVSVGDQETTPPTPSSAHSIRRGIHPPTGSSWRSRSIRDRFRTTAPTGPRFAPMTATSIRHGQHRLRSSTPPCRRYRSPAPSVRPSLPRANDRTVGDWPDGMARSALRRLPHCLRHRPAGAARTPITPSGVFWQVAKCGTRMKSSPSSSGQIRPPSGEPVVRSRSSSNTPPSRPSPSLPAASSLGIPGTHYIFASLGTECVSAVSVPQLRRGDRRDRSAERRRPPDAEEGDPQDR